MILYYNPTIFRNVRFEQVMNEEVELYLTSASNTFVVFDGQANVLFEGTLEECYIYTKLYKANKGFHPPVYSIEAYNNMINVMLKK